VVKRKNTRLKTISTVDRGRSKDIMDIQLVCIPSSVQSRSCSIQGLIPVVDSHNNPLIPCKISVARRLVSKNLAIPFFKKGFFCIKLRKVVENIQKKEVVLSIDPGSKRTGITISTKDSIILNVQCNTPDWIKKKVEQRKMYRRSRRSRNTPYRKCRFNRKIGGIPPSTKARWDCHLRILDQLSKILQINTIVIEDINAITKKNCRRWNKNFSPLEVGKKYFEQEVEKRDLKLIKFEGFDTKAQRDYRGFTKNSKKLAETWNTHCVDSHCLAEMHFNLDIEPNKSMYILNFLRFNRRELHQGYVKGGIKKEYGSTRSMGLNRGTLIKHKKHGLTYVGGNSKDRISLHNLKTSDRIARNIKKEACKILTKQSWRMVLSSPA